MIEVADLRLRQLGERHAVETVTALGVTARFRCTSAKELFRLRTLGGEPIVLDFLAMTLGAGDCFYDVGANTGFYAILAARVVGPSGHVVAFEPEPLNFCRLSQNAALNDLSNLTACPIALTDRSGLSRLRRHSSDFGEGAHALVEGGVSEGSVPAMSLDQALDVFGLRPPTVVKIDVEGHEQHVIAGMSRTLARPELRALAIEVHFFTATVDRRVPDSRDAMDARQRHVVSGLERHGFALRGQRAQDEGALQYAHLLFSR